MITLNFTVSNFCEIDKYAIDSYCRIHDEDKNKNLGDITTVKAEDIADCNVVVGGSPCFTSDTMVLTKYGYTPLKDIEIGDSVLSHDGRFHTVTAILSQGTKQIYTVKSNCFSPIKTTSNHRFYAKVEGGEPEWIEARNLTSLHYLGCHIGEPENKPNVSKKDLYTYGLLLRYDFTQENTTINLKVPTEIMPIIKKSLHKYDISFSVSVIEHDDTYLYINIYNSDIPSITKNLLTLSVEDTGILLSGYFENIDIKNDTFISDDLGLLYNISYLFMKYYKRPCQFKKYQNKYGLSFNSYVSNWHLENNYIWYPVTVSSTISSEKVFDLTVEDAHSFVVHHCTAHNCQDFSVSGKRKGAMWTCKDCGHQYNPLEVHYTKRDACPCCNSTNLEKTRSSLIVEYLRMIREKKPNFAVYENVKNLVGKEFKLLFDAFLEELHEYGYNTHYQVLNSKHFGIPQNRERVILIILKKELDNGQFKFPEPFDNGVRLIHVLENTVSHKYYVDNEKAETLLKTLSKEAMENISNTESPVFSEVKPQIDAAIENNENAVVQNKVCVASRGRYKENPNLRISGLPTEQRLEPNLNGTVNTLTSVQKDNLVLEQEIIVDEGIKPCVRKNFEREKQQIAESDKEIYQCQCDSGWQDNKIGIKVSPTLRANNPFTCVYANCCIRRLTPLECYRLMGFDDVDFDKARNGNPIMSDTQLYKQAGNSIVTNVLYYTYLNLYKAMPYLFDDIQLLSLFSGIGAFEKAFKMLQEYIKNPNYIPNDYRTIETENKPVRVGQVSSDGSQAGTVYSDKNIAPTICAGCHGYAMGYIFTENFQEPPMS